MAFDPAYATTSGWDSLEYIDIDNDVWSSSLCTEVTIPEDELDFNYGTYCSDVTSTDVTTTIPHNNMFDYSVTSDEISPSNAIGLVDDLTFGAQQQTFYTDVGLAAQHPHQVSGTVYEQFRDEYQPMVYSAYAVNGGVPNAAAPQDRSIPYKSGSPVDSLASAAASFSLDITQSQADNAALLQPFLERESYLAASGLDTEAASVLANALSSSQPETIDPSLLQTHFEMATAYTSSPSTSSGSLSTPTSLLGDIPLMVTPGYAGLPTTYPLQSDFSTLPSPPPAKLSVSSCSSPRKKARRPPPPPSTHAHATPAIGNIKLDRELYEHYRAQKRGVTDASGKTLCPVPGCHG